MVFIIHGQIVEALPFGTGKIDVRYFLERLRFCRTDQQKNCGQNAAGNTDDHRHATLSCNRRPAAPAARIMTGSGIFFVSISTVSVTIPIATVGISIRERRAKIYAAPAIAPTAAAVTPCTNAFTWRFLAKRL